jgi:oxygen-independent coproporphyrinogen III oxidase
MAAPLGPASRVPSDAVPVDIETIAGAIGGLPRVSYEAPHVYPLSAPVFASRPGTLRERPGAGPLKLYVHVPFCNYACTFCFYVKRIGASRPQMERYVAALERELQWVEEGTPLAQLYVGGGTPTALPADLFDRMLGAIHTRMPVVDGASLTVECSPESISEAHMDVLAARSVPRVSMGIESLDPETLATIHRKHDAEQAFLGCRRMVERGFYVNADLMYGFPGQSKASFRADLEAVAACGVQSISLYNLRLNERTPLARVVGDIERMDLAKLVGWRVAIAELMDGLGFEQARWHTWVRRVAGRARGFDRAPCVDGFDAGRQLGIGVSAVSHLGYTIFRNDEGFDSYMTRIEGNESPVDGVFSLEGEDDRHTLFVARTLGDGQALSRREYEAAFGHPLDADFGAVLGRLVDAELVADDGREIALTRNGRLVYDLVTLAFYPTEARDWLASRQGLATVRV